jgi:hypothetical protein
MEVTIEQVLRPHEYFCDEAGGDTFNEQLVYIFGCTRDKRSGTLICSTMYHREI